ncbi:glycosyltransferase family 2 protein [Haliscomenobacter sp.]|uniref:glycosyltransferase family 2 protein n=1 Tax=Haliscomenobacter sp. TaxID=2717303 RepID=UPI003592F332
MYKITIGIPTYKRPVMLDKLLKSIFACHLDPALVKQVDLIIVDNDVEKTGEPITAKWSKNATAPFCVHYFNCPTKGLSNVRNEIIDQALRLDPDYMVSVDDDQYVTSNWLNELISSIVNNRGDFALGPVIPIFETFVSPAIAQWFWHQKIEDQKKLSYLETANLVMRAQFIRDHHLRFDTRFNSLGAEDTYFGISALKKGANIFWAAKATVYETIPAKRATLQWLIKRRFRVANTYTYIMLLEKRYARVLKKILVNVAYLIVGALAMVLTPIGFKYRYFGVLKIAESFGGFAGLLNIKFHEYSTGR